MFHQGPKISHNYLGTEFEAARAYGLDPEVYFSKPRELRKLMVAWVIGDSSTKAMRDYDMAKERKEK